MKKHISLLCILVLVFAFTSCGSSNGTSGNDAGEEKVLYDENGFLISSNDFMELLNSTLQKLNEVDDHDTSLSKDSYTSTSEIEILRDGSESFLWLSLDQNENLDENMKEATMYLEEDKLLGNFTSYRSTIIDIMGALPLSLDNTITDYTQAHDFIVDLFNNVTEADFSKAATEGKHKIKSGALPYSFIKNGLTYTLHEDGDKLCLTVSVGEATIPSTKPLDESDFINLEASSEECIDMIKYLADYDVLWELFYYDPTTDESKEGVVTTARGIHIGDTRDAVEKAYGKNYVAHDELESAFLQGNETDGFLKATALSHIHYFTESGYSLTFCFDEDNEVSWIIYGDSTTAAELSK